MYFEGLEHEEALAQRAARAQGQPAQPGSGPPGQSRFNVRKVQFGKKSG